MQIPLVRSRNFTSHEVARSALVVDAPSVLLTGYAMGYIQAFRDVCAHEFGPRFKGIVITSSNRAAYNSTVKNAAHDSHHIWRLEPDGALHVALDCKPVGVTLHEFYELAVRFCKGEIYLNLEEGIVHIAPVPMEEEHWIQ